MFNLLQNSISETPEILFCFERRGTSVSPDSQCVNAMPERLQAQKCSGKTVGSRQPRGIEHHIYIHHQETPVIGMKTFREELYW